RRLGVVLRTNQPREPLRPGDVRALADHLEVGVRTYRQRFQTGELGIGTAKAVPYGVVAGRPFGAFVVGRPFRGAVFVGRPFRGAVFVGRPFRGAFVVGRPFRGAARFSGAAGRQPFDALRDRGDMVRGRAAAAADDVHEAAGGELVEVPAGLIRLLVVLTEGVWQAGIRVAAHVTPGDARELREVRAHVARAEGAVEADAERPRVRHRDPEGVNRLPRQRPAAAVGDRRRDHERQPHALFLEDLFDRDDARLGVQRVDDRLEQEQVAPAVDEAACLL